MKALMKVFSVLVVFLILSIASAQDKPRLLVLTDIGGDPDDQQSLVRLMTYANEFDFEGFVATSNLGHGVDTDPDLIHEIIDAYEQVRPNLLLHKSDYPSASFLRGLVKTGNPEYGIEDVGAGKDTEGSNWIISVVDKNDSRPVNITVWGGTTDLAQALWRVRNDRTQAQLEAFIAKIRVHAILHQDTSGPWIMSEFPNLFYILNKGEDSNNDPCRGMYKFGDTTLVDLTWGATNVRTNHGPLGAIYPPSGAGVAGTKEGDTPSYFYFLPLGMNSPENPTWGGWGGRYQVLTAPQYNGYADDTDSGVTNGCATVFRWRLAYQNDFAARMDWCINSYAQANHNPIANLAGTEARTVAPGATVTLDASGSTDPDGDSLSYNWWQYKEADSYTGSVSISNSNNSVASFTAPSVSTVQTVHIILEVKDNGSPNLSAFKRIVVTVDPNSNPPPADNAHYVDKNANGSNNGTSWANAWESFSAINWSAVDPGDTIYISGGSTSKTYYEQMFVGTSGSTSGRITITKGVDAGHNGEVIIDSQNSRYCGIQLYQKNYINVKNLSVRNAKFVSNSLEEGNIHLRNVNHVTIENCQIYTPYVRGIMINGYGDGGEDVLIKDCTITTPVINNNSQLDGVYCQLYKDVTFDGNNILIQQQNSDEHCDCIQTFKTENITMKNNFLKNTSQATLNQHVIMVERNKGYFYIYNNIMISDMPNNTGTGLGIFFGNRLDSSYRGTYTVYNNTFDLRTCKNGFALSDIPNSTIKNNIIYGGEKVWRITDTNMSTLDIDNNYYRCTGDIAYTRPTGQSETYLNWSEWLALGFDDNSIKGTDPGLVDIGAENFELKSTSPCINKGVTYTPANPDFFGNPRDSQYDWGALEYVDTAPPTSPTADAGQDQTVNDNDNSGAESVTLNGSGSSDPDGTLTSYIWRESGTQIASGVNPTVSLNVGTHTIVLTVTDNDGNTDTDTVVVNVNPDVSQNQKLPVVQATSSSDDGNVAANTLDGSLSTRWSADGDGEWIRFELAQSTQVSQVKAAFFVGDTRSSILDVQVSENGSSWTNVVTGFTSSGSSLNLETITFTPVNAKYIRLLGHGNSSNLWNSYTEVEIWGTPQPATKYTLTVNSGSGDGDYTEGTVVNISANAAPAGQEFDAWTGNTANIANVNNASTTINMPAANVNITATYKDLPPATYALTVNSGSGDGDYTAGTIVNITADAAPAGQEFDAWTGNTANVANVNNASTTITMPAAAATITATYKDLPPVTYALTVNSGSGDGNYAEGTVVNINADAAPTGQTFDMWTGDTAEIANILNASTTLNMPPANVSITATYKDLPPQEGDSFLEANGTICMEAENFDGSDPRTDPNGVEWTVESTTADSIGTYVTTLGSQGSNGTWTNGCELSYQIQISTPGTYKIWMRRYATHSANNSGFIGADHAQAGYDNGGTNYGEWSWKGGYDLTLAAGTHTIQLRRREMGYMVDRIYLTMNGDTPSGDGPAESARGGDNPPPTEYTLTVNNGTGSGDYAEGAVLNISADTAPTGQEFDVWTGNIANIADVNGASTTITMPAANTSVTATYKDLPPATYTLTVNSGSGDGNYTAGALVNITADAAPTGQEFDAWTGDVANIANVNSASTDLTMPAANITVTATYKDIQQGGDLVVSIVNVASGQAYQVVENVQAGTKLYIDRNYTFSTLSSELSGQILVQTANNDKNNSSEQLLTLNLSSAATLYVLYDVRGTSLPNWLADWTVSSETATSNDDGSPYQILKKDFSAGNVIMGGNKATGAVGAGSNYIVIAVGSGTTPPPPTEYALTVNSGSGSGNYQAGTVVNINANTAPSGQEFDVWTGDVANVANVNSASTSITMPAAAVAITATYKDLPPVNQAPVVDAGADQVITLPASVNLNGTVTDDGLPAAYTVQWTIISGPGDVTFGNANAVDTSASFAVDGTYVLRLTANDTELQASSDVTIIVNPEPVDPPPTGNGFIEANGAVCMEAENFDAADPRTDPNGVEWAVESTTAGAIGEYVTTPGQQGSNGGWNDACELSYQVEFSTPGTYKIWVRRYAGGIADNSAYLGMDGTQAGYDNANTNFGQWAWKGGYDLNVTAGTHTIQVRRREAGYKIDRIYITMNGDTPSGDGPAESARGGADPINQAPTVNAGGDQAITLPTDTVNLDATVTDDGQTAQVTYLWETVNGPGVVVFADETAVDSTATFGIDGTYILRLTADDGEFQISDEITITVNPEEVGGAGIISDDFNDNAIGAIWQTLGSFPTAEVNQQLAVDTANSSGSWLWGGLATNQIVDISSVTTYKVDVTVPDTSSNQFTSMFVTPALSFDSEGNPDSHVRVYIRAAKVYLQVNGATKWSEASAITAGNPVTVKIEIDNTNVTLSLNGVQKYTGTHNLPALSAGAYFGFRAANKSDATGGIVTFDNFDISQ